MFNIFAYYGSLALAIYKTFTVVITIVSVAGIAYIVKKSGELRRTRESGARKVRKPEDDLGAEGPSVFSLDQLRDTTAHRWQNIVEKLASQLGEKDFKAALIEADALVDAALRENGFPGETMGDRLRAVPAGRLASLNDLWKAHRVRNEIAHDPYYVVSPREGHDMMRIYKHALEELGTL